MPVPSMEHEIGTPILTLSTESVLSVAETKEDDNTTPEITVTINKQIVRMCSLLILMVTFYLFLSNFVNNSTTYTSSYSLKPTNCYNTLDIRR